MRKLVFDFKCDPVILTSVNSELRASTFFPIGTVYKELLLFAFALLNSSSKVSMSISVLCTVSSMKLKF